MHARIIRVFVSSPGDVAQERDALDEIVQAVNGDTGQQLGLRLELFRWERDVVPQIGPQPQQVVDRQTPAYDVYLGILSKRFGTPTERYGSGTEEEFHHALENWQTAGSPWIAFYFDDAPEARLFRKSRASFQPAERATGRIELRQAMQHDRLVIIGDPGSGKTTLLRRITLLASEAPLRGDLHKLREHLGLERPWFPVFVRVADLIDYIATAKSHPLGPLLARTA